MDTYSARYSWLTGEVGDSVVHVVCRRARWDVLALSVVAVTTWILRFVLRVDTLGALVFLDLLSYMMASFVLLGICFCLIYVHTFLLCILEKFPHLLAEVCHE